MIIVYVSNKEKWKSEDPTLLKITRMYAENEELKYKTEKLDQEKFLKSVKTDNEEYK